MVDRLTLVDSSLPERIVNADATIQRQVAVAMAVLALDHIGVTDHPVTAARAALQAGNYGESAERSALSAFVDELDTAAFDAQDRLDDGTGTDAEYIGAFGRARAATALLSALDGDPYEAAADAIYEAYHALDEDIRAVLRVVNAASTLGHK